MLAAGTGGIHHPTPTQIAASAGAPTEKQVSLAQTLLIAAAFLFVLEMILRRYSIANRHIAAFFRRLRGKPLDPQVISSPISTTSAPKRDVEATASPQLSETSMTRLLAAKKRAH
jgi:hypothetical protein